MGNPVDEQCTASKIKDDAGREACSDLCAGYACCFGTFTCTDKTVGECSVFAVCQILQTDFGRMANPLWTACSDVNIATEDGREKCTNLCMDAVCCFNGEDCREDTDCSYYASCDNLNGEEAPKGLGSSESETGGKDLPVDFVELPLVGGTQALKGLGSSESESGGNPIDFVEMPSVPRGGMMGNPVDEQCTASKIKDDAGREACSDLCAGYACCFGTFTCTDKTVGECSVFAACQILHTHIGRMASPLDTACSDANIATEKGREKCSDLCKDAVCCFDGEDCREDTDCSYYASCVKLNQEVAVFDEVCKEDHMTSKAGREACESACEGKECCYDENAICIAEVVECEQYESCKVLKLYKTGPEDPKHA